MGLYGSVLYATAIVLLFYSLLLSQYSNVASHVLTLQSTYSTIVSMEAFDTAISYSMPPYNSSSYGFRNWLAMVYASANADRFSVNKSGGVLIIKSLVSPEVYSTIKLN